MLSLIKKRDIEYKANGRESIQFRKLKNMVNNKIKNLKSNYINNQWQRAGSDIKKQSKLLNDLVKGKVDIQNNIESINVDGSTITDNQDIVDKLNLYFATVGMVSYRE